MYKRDQVKQQGPATWLSVSRPCKNKQDEACFVECFFPDQLARPLVYGREHVIRSPPRRCSDVFPLHHCLCTSPKPTGTSRYFNIPETRPLPLFIDVKEHEKSRKVKQTNIIDWNKRYIYICVHTNRTRFPIMVTATRSHSTHDR